MSNENPKKLNAVKTDFNTICSNRLTRSASSDSILSKKPVKKGEGSKSQPGKLWIDLMPTILKFAITTSDKPTNTAFACMCTSREWSARSKTLFERDPEVHASFATQIQKIKVFTDRAVSAHKNTFFFLWMVNFLKNKKIQCQIDPEILKKKDQNQNQLLEEFRGQEMQKGPCTKNNCKAILESVFETPIISHEITFAEFLPFFNGTLYKETVQVTKYPLSNYLSYEILLHILKNTSLSSSFILIEKILEETTNSNNIKLNEQKFEKSYKLSRLIIRLGDYVIKLNSPIELKTAYLKLLEKFFYAFHWNDELKQSFVYRAYLSNLATKFIQFLPSESTGIPTCTFDLIFELTQFPNDYELVSAIIEKIKQMDYFSLDNVLKIKNKAVQMHFLMDIAHKPDISFNIEQVLNVIAYLDKNKNLFLENTKDYLKLIEMMVTKMPNNSPEEKGKVLESIEGFFIEIKVLLAKQKNQFTNDYTIVMQGFLSYLKFLK